MCGPGGFGHEAETRVMTQKECPCAFRAFGEERFLRHELGAQGSSPQNAQNTPEDGSGASRVFRDEKLLHYSLAASVVIGRELPVPPMYNPLKKNLNVPCGWPRNRISGPNSSSCPSPTGASATATVRSR